MRIRKTIPSHDDSLKTNGEYSTRLKIERYQFQLGGFDRQKSNDLVIDPLIELYRVRHI